MKRWAQGLLSIIVLALAACSTTSTSTSSSTAPTRPPNLSVAVGGGYGGREKFCADGPLKGQILYDGTSVYNDGSVGAVTVSDTSIDHNVATGDGGGIYNNGATLGLTSSVSVNSNTAGSGASGGGIYSTVALSPPAPTGVVAHNIPDDIVIG